MFVLERYQTYSICIRNISVLEKCIYIREMYVLETAIQL